MADVRDIALGVLGGFLLNRHLSNRQNVYQRVSPDEVRRLSIDPQVHAYLERVVAQGGEVLQRRVADSLEILVESAEDSFDHFVTELTHGVISPAQLRERERIRSEQFCDDDEYDDEYDASGPVDDDPDDVVIDVRFEEPDENDVIDVTGMGRRRRSRRHREPRRK